MNVQNPAMGSAPNPSITQGEVARLRDMMMAMPLPQLQAYAAQHIHDPNGGIIVGLASQIANAKKSAGVPQQPQSSVAQQAVQGIAPMQVQQAQTAPPALPENQGIGQLPAQNIEGMAGGGIVGYADGGHIPRYAGSTDGSFVMPTDQSLMGDVPIYTNTPLLPQQGAPENNQVPPLRQLYRDYMERRSNPTNPMNNFFGVAGSAAPTPPPVQNSAPNPTDARLAAGTQMPPGGPVANLNANIPDIDPKTKKPPKVTDAKKEGTVASNQLNNLLTNSSTSGYTPLSQADIDTAMNPQGVLAAPDMAKQSAEISKDKDAAANAQYKAISDQTAADRKRLDDRMDNSSAMATMLAGLSMIKSGNPWEAIAQGAAKGLAQYGDEQKYFDTARRELNHADLQMQTALDARLNNNERDAQKYMELAQTSKENAVRTRLSGIQLLNTAQYQAGQLGMEGRKIALTEKLAPYQQSLMLAQAGWYGQRGAGLMSKLSAQQLAQVDKLATADMLKWRTSPENMGRSDEEANEYYQQRAAIHAATLGTNTPSSDTVTPTVTSKSTAGFKMVGG